MKETGKVVKIYDGFADVAFTRKSACGENCAHCSADCLKKEHIAKVLNPLSASIGDEVLVEANQKKAYLSMFLVFILPIIIFTAAFVIAHSVFCAKGVSFVVAFIILALYYLIIKHFESKISPTPFICAISKKGGEI